MLFGNVSFLPDQLVHTAHPAIAEPLNLKANAGESQECVAGAGKVPLSAATGQGTTKSITGAGVHVIRIGRKCPCENGAGYALNLSHQCAKLKFSIAFTCINRKTTNCLVFLGFGVLHILLHLVLNKHCSDSFPLADFTWRSAWRHFFGYKV